VEAVLAPSACGLLSHVAACDPIVSLMAVIASQNCKWLKTNVARCLFPQYFAGGVATRLFPLQSLYDPLQI
jgi:hypothetical protein